jgi:hypothetical protein
MIMGQKVPAGVAGYRIDHVEASGRKLLSGQGYRIWKTYNPSWPTSRSEA